MRGGERVVVNGEPDPRELAFLPQAIALSIIDEDDALIVVDKPAGLVVHPGSGNWEGTLANALLHHAPQLAGVPRAGIVHRLDKDTSGLLVVAKTLTAQTALVRQLQARTVTREYVALAAGDLTKRGMVDAPIGRHPTRRTTMAIVATGKPARTHFDVVERFGDGDAPALPPRDRAHAPDPRAPRVARPSAGRRSHVRAQGADRVPAPGAARRAALARPSGHRARARVGVAAFRTILRRS